MNAKFVEGLKKDDYIDIHKYCKRMLFIKRLSKTDPIKAKAYYDYLTQAVGYCLFGYSYLPRINKHFVKSFAGVYYNVSIDIDLTYHNKLFSDKGRSSYYEFDASEPRIRFILNSAYCLKTINAKSGSLEFIKFVLKYKKLDWMQNDKHKRKFLSKINISEKEYDVVSEEYVDFISDSRSSLEKYLEAKKQKHIMVSCLQYLSSLYIAAEHLKLDEIVVSIDSIKELVNATDFPTYLEQL